MCNLFQKTCYVPKPVLGIMGKKEMNQFYILLSANKEVKKTSRNRVVQNIHRGSKLAVLEFWLESG